ncbi:MAG: pilus assembly protein PilM [Deltaproteobacteria bacterium]|nr:pilus assembly protein PilM [Deltaproteobacteria bacterium]
MAQKIIGLDIGSWSVKATVLESSLRRVSLVGFHEHHLPVDASGQTMPGELPAAVRATLAGLDVDVVATAVPGVQVLTRELDLPFSDEKRIAPVLGFQLEGLLPRPIDSVIYDWHILKKKPDGARLLCPAADKAWLEGWLAEVKAGGVDPRYVTLSALALQHLTPHLAVDAGDRPWAIIDMGHRSTQITLIQSGRVEAFRTLSRGGHQVTQAIARALGVNYTDAEHAKHTQVSLAGAAAHGPLAQAAGQALEPLFREIKVTIDKFAERGQGEAGAGGRERISEVVLIGGAARLPGVDALLARMLGVPVGPPRPSGVIWDQVRKAPDLFDLGLPSVGLALEHVGDHEHRVNFRRGGGGFGDLGALRAKAGWIAAFLAVALVLFFVRKQLRASTLEDQQAQLVARLDEYTKKVLDGPVSPNAEPAARFKAVKTLVTSPPESEVEYVYPGMTAFRIFYEVTKAQDQINDKAMPPEPEPPDPEDPDPIPTPPAPVIEPADRRQIELSSFQADLKSATVSGIGYDIGTIEELASKLREHPCFKKVDLKETRKTTRHPTRPAWLDFTLKLDVKCEPRATPAPATATAGGGADKATATTEEK